MMRQLRQLRLFRRERVTWPEAFARRQSGWSAAFALAAAWALLPALPALSRGALLGSPFTDLYPSVWGLAWFASQQPGLPTATSALAAPVGMPFYYSSPLHGWAGAIPFWLGGPAFAYNLTLLAARFATVAVSFGCFRAGGLGVLGALAAAGVYGASPFFHGYAVEGIVEGTDGWTLPLWAWCVLRKERAASIATFALVVISSWYLGMVACVLAAFWGLRDRLAWASMLGGLVLASPFLLLFVKGFSAAAPLPDAIRAAMGTPLGWAPPGVLPGLNPFAITTFVGVSTLVLAARTAREKPWFAGGALLCAVLALGRGPWYDLPVLEAVRFPYRWHAGVLFCLAPLVGLAVDRIGKPWLAFLPVVEGLLLSRVEPVIPGAPAEVPAIYDAVRGPILLEVPGPVAMAPGEINRSRPRARYLLYHQAFHGAASPWAPDFNGVAATLPAPWLASFASWDPLMKSTAVPPDLAGAKAAGVTQILVHRDELGGNAEALEHALREAGAQQEAREGDLVLFRI
ncbi:MAG: hypothetical protein ACK4YP_13395, partial [Myxococcota bacterium]